MLNITDQNYKKAGHFASTFYRAIKKALYRATQGFGIALYEIL